MGAFPEELKILYASAHWRYVMRPAIFKRDNYTCQICKRRIPPGKGSKTLHLQADHLLYPAWGSPLEAYLNQPLSQIQTVCNTCHKAKTKLERQQRKSKTGYT
jgi:5-methylcytosine-specific restriction endonuclease McrA